MPAEWTRLESDHREWCASDSHGERRAVATWRMEAGDVGSFYCETCRYMISRGPRFGDGKAPIETTPSAADDSGIFRTWLGQ